MPRSRLSTPPEAARPRRLRRLGLVGLVMGLAALLALCEALGWPFLAAPGARWLGHGLGRSVSLNDAAGNSFRLHLIGGIRLDVGRLRIADADWAGTAPMVDVQGLHLAMRWRDALAWRPGQPLRLDAVVADALALRLQRLADGRANWVLGSHAAASTHTPRLQDLLRVGHLQLRSASAQISDAVLQLDATAGAELGDLPATGSAGAGAAGNRLSAHADGRYQNLPLQATLQADGQLPWLTDAAAGAASNAALPLQLAVSVGRARLAFDGQVRDLLGLRGVQGHYRVSGPSLAAVGAPLRLTLPTTGAFAMAGRLLRDGHHWFTAVDSASVGRSRLAGEFTFDAPPGAVPLLAGRLHGPLLMLQDLGPAVGAATAGAAPARPGRVLPDHRFDLPSLRAMNANVLLAVDQFDFGTVLLQAAAPLQAHLVLSDGVLLVDALDATLAQGRLSGRIQLDGRQPEALWQVDLAGRGLLLEQWIRPLQRPQRTKQPSQPDAVRQAAPRTEPGTRPPTVPYASGRLAARLHLDGHGRSVADLLASANGRILLHWTQGTVSHLAVEAAGLDIAQALGVLLKGDDALRVDCGAGDLAVRAGRVTPSVLLIDTRDSTLWLDGHLSLDTERLALVAHVQPKDWSPLALRTPLHIDGALAHPVLSLDKGPLLQKLLPAALLALVNPLAAMLPLMEAGSADASGDSPGTASCRAAAARFRQGLGLRPGISQGALPAAASPGAGVVCRTCPTAQAAAVRTRRTARGGDNVS